MRIVAGRLRGRRLAALGKGDPAAHLRPTSDRVRESLFSRLAHRDAIAGRRVLDLFAGTGALGLEAVSRGAAQATFVENGRKGASLVRQNIRDLSLGSECALLERDATRLPPCGGSAFDLVFLDPPYGKGLGQLALERAAAGGWIAPGAVIVWEEQAEMVPPDGFVSDDSRRYGDSWIHLMSYAGDGKE
ncbi:MAG: 16S rRNA (guanine(966)-N(2))-methyltransferase RsmD [Marinibacterium sp.]